MGRRYQESFDRSVWEAAKEVAFAVADTRSADELGQAVMEALDRMIGFDLGTILTAELGQRWSIAGESRGLCDALVLERNYWRYAGELLPEEIARKVGRFTAASEVFEARRRERLSIFTEFLIPRGLNQATVGFWVIDGRAWSLGLMRGGRGFPDRALTRLNALLPHLKAALRARTWRPYDEGSSSTRLADASISGRPWGLTVVQERTMNLVVRGLTNKEVAGLLGTSANTVRNTLVQVFEKVGVTRRSELAFIVRSGPRDGDPCDPRDVLAHQRAFIETVASRSRTEAAASAHVEG